MRATPTLACHVLKHDGRMVFLMSLFWLMFGFTAFSAFDLTEQELEKRYGSYISASECYDKFTAKIYGGIGWLAQKGGAAARGKWGTAISLMGRFIRAYPADWKCFCQRVRYSIAVFEFGEWWNISGETMLCRITTTANRYLLPDPKSCTRPVHGEPTPYYMVYGDGLMPECP